VFISVDIELNIETTKSSTQQIITISQHTVVRATPFILALGHDG